MGALMGAQLFVQLLHRVSTRSQQALGVARKPGDVAGQKGDLAGRKRQNGRSHCGRGRGGTCFRGKKADRFCKSVVGTIPHAGPDMSQPASQ
jgi:hypothetical protein